MSPETISYSGRPVFGFGDAATPLPAKCIPPLELRTAYTIKGLGIGGGGLVGYLVGGPIGMIVCGFGGWWAGNAVACNAERKYGQ